MDALLLPQQAAELLSLPLSAVYRLTRLGRLPVVNLGSRYRYDPEAIREWVRSGGVPKTQDQPAPKTPVPELAAVTRPGRKRAKRGA